MASKHSNIRREYTRYTLDDSGLPDHPLHLFEQWFAEALEKEIRDANAFHLATASDDGNPSIRVVLLKEVNLNGFVFFTNYNSQKGLHLAKRPNCSMNFYWAELERQVRIEGKAEKIPASESDAYFDSRPEGSRIAANASPQSDVIENREQLEKKFREAENRFNSGQTQRPLHWGGYVILPERIEFWQGRMNRMHDRVRYDKASSGNWKRLRLAP